MKYKLLSLLLIPVAVIALHKPKVETQIVQTSPVAQEVTEQPTQQPEQLAKQPVQPAVTPELTVEQPTSPVEEVPEEVSVEQPVSEPTMSSLELPTTGSVINSGPTVVSTY
jgi:hypothetical protein